MTARPLASRCERCGHRTVPARAACPACRSWDVAMCQLSGVGTVRAIVELHISSDGIQAPYSVAHVDVDGVLMFARVEGEAAVGDTVTYRCDGDKFWFADEAVDG